MQDFSLYFSWGWHHIISWDALDHLLFIVALTVIYQLRDWKQVLILVTAFTIGHFITLLLSVLDIIRFSSQWVEFLIPVTIVITAASQFFSTLVHPQSSFDQLSPGPWFWIDPWYGVCQCNKVFSDGRTKPWVEPFCL